jgi:hypothetical protein
LLDDDAVLSDAGESVTSVCNAWDGTSGSRDGFDADTVIAVDDLVVGEVDVADSIIGAAANRTDREAVSSSARTAREGDISYEQYLVNVSSQDDVGLLTARVDGDTVILVVNDSVGDGNTGRASDIEGIWIRSENCDWLYLR